MLCHSTVYHLYHLTSKLTAGSCQSPVTRMTRSHAHICSFQSVHISGHSLVRTLQQSYRLVPFALPRFQLDCASRTAPAVRTRTFGKALPSLVLGWLIGKKAKIDDFARVDSLLRCLVPCLSPGSVCVFSAIPESRVKERKRPRTQFRGTPCFRRQKVRGRRNGHRKKSGFWFYRFSRVANFWRIKAC